MNHVDRIRARTGSRHFHHVQRVGFEIHADAGEESISAVIIRRHQVNIAISIKRHKGIYGILVGRLVGLHNISSRFAGGEMKFIHLPIPVLHEKRISSDYQPRPDRRRGRCSCRLAGNRC